MNRAGIVALVGLQTYTEGMTNQELDSLEALAQKFEAGNRTIETLEINDDECAIMHQWEDTEPFALLTMPNDDDWRPEYAKLVYMLTQHATALVAAARRAERLEKTLETIADTENPEHYGNARDALHAVKLAARAALDGVPA